MAAMDPQPTMANGTRRRRWALLLAMLPLSSAWSVPALSQSQELMIARSNQTLTGTRSRLPKDWQGLRVLPAAVEILVMPGHADSQGFGGGASGAAVGVYGARPMDPSMSDELFWNLLTVEAVVRLGQARGLNIRSYDPGIRSIAKGSDPRTTWSVGKAHVQAGGYAFEIHYDAHGSAGVGSGLIPPIGTSPSQLDESLADEFGAFPRWFRDGLGAPKRGIAILEIGKLEGQLEASLRNPASRTATLDAIAQRVVLALERGLTSGQDQAQPDIAGRYSGDRTIELPPLSPPPDVVGSAP
jgi:hypothetical protein